MLNGGSRGAHDPLTGWDEPGEPHHPHLICDSPDDFGAIRRNVARFAVVIRITSWTYTVRRTGAGHTIRRLSEPGDPGAGKVLVERF